MSPWELEPIDEDRRPAVRKAGVPVLPAEIVRTLYQPQPEDWEGDRDIECDRISAGLSQVMELAIAEPFASQVDLHFYPYPMDLSTIKRRLDNRFYRRTSAVEFDIRYIYANAHKFCRAQSDFVRSALIIRDLCLNVIRNRNAVDVVNIYQQLTPNCELRHEGTVTSGPSTSRAEATPNTSSRGHRHSQLSDSELEEDPARSVKKGGAASKSKVNC